MESKINANMVAMDSKIDRLSSKIDVLIVELKELSTRTLELEVDKRVRAELNKYRQDPSQTGPKD